MKNRALRSSIRWMRRSISHRFVTSITAAGGKKSRLMTQVKEEGGHPSRLIIAAVALLTASSAFDGAQAQDRYRWCAQMGHRDRPTNCYFVTP